MDTLEERLKRLGLSQYLEALVSEGFDTWETVLGVTESDLSSLNFKLGHRRKLQRAIAESQGQSSSRLLPIAQGKSMSVEEPYRSDHSANESRRNQGKTSATGATATTKRKYRRHPKPDENAPERPPSAYVIFSNQVRKLLKGQELSFTEFAKVVRDRWQGLPAEERETYESQANTAKEKYYTELAGYKETPQYAAYQRYLEEFKKKHAAPSKESKHSQFKIETSVSIGGKSDSTSSESHHSSLDINLQPSHNSNGQMNYVEPQFETDRRRYKVFPNPRRLIDTVLRYLLLSESEPPIPQGKVRARWKCRCGKRLFDDFTELEVGSVKDLERELQELEDSANTSQTFGETISGGFRALWRPIEHRLQKSNPANSGPGNLLPLEENGKRSDTLALSNLTEQLEQTRPTPYLLLCIDNGKSGTPLHQEFLGVIRTDRILFFFLQSSYLRHWNVQHWITLRKIRALSLSRFALDYSNFTEIHKHASICSPICVCLPPVERLKEYHCRPAPGIKPRYEPVIGSQRLTHYFLSPQCVDVSQETILAQLPKRVCQLKASITHEELGWGIYFEEGWDWNMIYALVVVLALFSVVFGIVWSILKGDIQGAFTISSFCVTLGSLLLSYIVVKTL